MRPGEWSRSRYWLSHFLNSRHVRPRMAWSSPVAARTDVAAAALPWLAGMVNRTGVARAWVVKRAAEQHKADPAFVQCLRLMIREEQHHRELAAKLHVRAGLSMPAAPPPGKDLAKPLGVRFRLSVQLMSDLLDADTLDRIAAATCDEPMRTACTTIVRERQMHVAFMAERLADEFADFHFARRNLRRWRVRGMFAGLMASRYAEQRALMHAMNVPPTDWASHTWQHFAAVLERIVPYHRDELLRLLTAQREHPYDRPS